MAQWKTLNNAEGKSGVRYREHKTRKHGAVPDRYYTLAYWRQSRTVSEPLGWASDGWTPTKCFDILAQLKHNQATGNGPCTFSEMRAQADRNRATEKAEVTRQDAVLADAWAAYLEARRDKWSTRHYADHIDLARTGGEPVKRRGRKGAKIKPGLLAALMPLRLAELTPARVEAWAKSESGKRGARTRLAFSLLRAFVNWSNETPKYKGIVLPDACSTRIKKETIPRMKPKDDCLQREQLPAWFKAVRGLQNLIASAYLQTLLLTGARRNELAGLTWDDIDFRWNAIVIHDKVEGERTIPLTPYVAALLSPLPRRNQWVFSSPTSKDGRLQEPRIPHNRALAVAGIDGLTLHGLRRSFGTLSEWVEVPAGVVAQIMGHKPSAIAEKHYRRRPLDLLRMWHVKIEAWILEQAGLEQPAGGEMGLQVVKGQLTKY